jgi:alkanesulfonate monooxygenase SsuD/methylene tetrahydromethanopterin reductase-like flavin-dependent oxidoreductase (luciferase family)
MAAAFKLAVTGWPSEAGWDAKSLCRQARKAEALGFHSIWLPENHFGDHRSIPSPLTLLAAVAAATERIGLGSTSYLLPIRHPLLAAEEVAVLDQLSQGRVILGVGRGIQPSVFEAFGVSSKEKRKVFQANLEIMIAAWSGKPVLPAGEEGSEGRTIRLAPLPVQRPHPPIWVAAFGPLALQQVAALGLPYLASPVETLDTLEQNYREYQRLLAESGKAAVRTIPVMRTVFISADRSLVKTVRAGLESLVPRLMRKEAVEVKDWVLVGDRDYVGDKLQEYRERLQLSHLIVRGGLPGVDSAAQWQSLEQLVDIS